MHVEWSLQNSCLWNHESHTHKSKTHKDFEMSKKCQTWCIMKVLKRNKLMGETAVGVNASPSPTAGICWTSKFRFPNPQDAPSWYGIVGCSLPPAKPSHHNMGEFCILIEIVCFLYSSLCPLLPHWNHHVQEPRSESWKKKKKIRLSRSLKP